MLFMEDPKYKHGFKFDHVWNTVRHFEKFKYDVNPQINTSRKHGVNYLSSESENPEDKLTRHKIYSYSGRQNIYMPYEQPKSSSCSLNG